MKSAKHQASSIIKSGRKVSQSFEQNLNQIKSRNLSLPKLEDENDLIRKAELCNKPVTVNIKFTLVIEDKLWEILDMLRKNVAAKFPCDEYWLMNEDDPINKLEFLFGEKRMKSLIKQANVLEKTSIGISRFCFGKELPNDLMQEFRNLFFYVHQNYLILIKLMLLRYIDSGSNNTWIRLLNQRIEEKQVDVIKNGSITGFLKQHTEIIYKLLQNIAAIIDGEAKDYVKLITDNLEQMTISKVKKIFNSLADNVQSFSVQSPSSPKSEIPYLPPMASPGYTLVIDLDETLVHYADSGPNGILLVRPGSVEFLNEMKNYYEIVIFTAALPDYANWAIEQIDTSSAVSHRLYRQHTNLMGPAFIKDLKCLGRDLRKTIIIDNIPDNFKNQIENGITVKSWYGELEDTFLYELIPLLKEIVIKKVPDVRVALRIFRDQVLRQFLKGISKPHLNLKTTKSD
ncbi:unnamed protein product [Blepharisma stoltei]|uniref:Mitochondrial import inner membrane translocase subunit TIM50 n=1 Tax=Blepharisma stoltei TaxID=1481888 RepID=A0AAU9J8Q8_9CILI|nr:unnamed protein product [Blepharisma stoltei]